MKCSIEWCSLDLVTSNGLAEVLHTLVSDFGTPKVLTRAFIQHMLGTSDKTKVRDSTQDLHLFKIDLENFH